MTRSPTVQLRHLARCLDGRRVPLNAEERATLPGDYPYWGANGVVDAVGEYLFDETIVLLGEDGAPFGDYTKDVAFLVDGRVWVNNHIHVLRPSSRVDARFLTYALNAVDWPAFISGSTRDKLTQDDMNRAPVACPSLSAQRAIADYLDAETARIDALIAKKQQLIELLESRFKALATSLLLPQSGKKRELPATTRPQVVLEYHLSQVPKTWKLASFRRIARLSSEVNSDGKSDLISLTIRGETVRRSSDQQPPSPEYLFRYNRIRPGQLVVNPMWLVGGSIGVSTVRGAVSPDYRVYDLDESVNPQFLHFLMRSTPYREQYQLLIRAETTFDRRVTKDDFQELLIPLPPLEEQAALCSRLSFEATRLAPLKTKLDSQIQLMRELRQVLITAAVTGEFEIPGRAA